MQLNSLTIKEIVALGFLIELEFTRVDNFPEKGNPVERTYSRMAQVNPVGGEFSQK